MQRDLGRTVFALRLLELAAPALVALVSASAAADPATSDESDGRSWREMAETRDADRVQESVGVAIGPGMQRELDDTCEQPGVEAICGPLAFWRFDARLSWRLLPHLGVEGSVTGSFGWTPARIQRPPYRMLRGYAGFRKLFRLGAVEPSLGVLAGLLVLSELARPDLGTRAVHRTVPSAGLEAPLGLVLENTRISLVPELLATYFPRVPGFVPSSPMFPTVRRSGELSYWIGLSLRGEIHFPVGGAGERQVAAAD